MRQVRYYMYKAGTTTGWGRLWGERGASMFCERWRKLVRNGKGEAAGGTSARPGLTLSVYTDAAGLKCVTYAHNGPGRVYLECFLEFAPISGSFLYHLIGPCYAFANRSEEGTTA